MSLLDVYITATARVAGLADGDATAPCPAVGSPMFPPPHRGHAPHFFAIQKGVVSGRLRGVQVDWGSWAARMDRAAIERLIDEIYGPPGEYEAACTGYSAHLAEWMQRLRQFVAELPPDREFAVVCSEL